MDEKQKFELDTSKYIDKYFKFISESTNQDNKKYINNLKNHFINYIIFILESLKIIKKQDINSWIDFNQQFIKKLIEEFDKRQKEMANLSNYLIQKSLERNIMKNQGISYMANPMNNNMGMLNPMNNNMGMLNPNINNMGMLNPMNNNMGMLNPNINNMGMFNPMNNNMAMLNPNINNMGMLNPMNNNMAMLNPNINNMGMLNPMNNNMGMLNPNINNMGMFNTMNNNMDMFNPMNNNIANSNLNSNNMNIPNPMSNNMIKNIFKNNYENNSSNFERENEVFTSKDIENKNSEITSDIQTFSSKYIKDNEPKENEEVGKLLMNIAIISRKSFEDSNKFIYLLTKEYKSIHNKFVEKDLKKKISSFLKTI